MSNLFFIVLLFTTVCGLTFANLNTARCSTLKLKNGRARYRNKGKFARFQCNTGYQLAGEKYSSCIRGKWESPPPVCVRPTCTTPKTPVNGLIYASHRGAVLNFYCKPGYSLRGENVTYCDGLRWSYNLPTCTETGKEPAMSCDFESEDLCGWSHDLNHDFDWRRQNYKTPSGHVGTGPSFDHTKGPDKDGYYVYIESSSRLENDTARLISPVYNEMEDGFCFKFYYHMYGKNMGSLKIYLKKEKDSSDTKQLNPLWSQSGNQGDVWHKGVVELSTVDEPFQIIIEGIRGGSYISDIAVDDVSITDSCPEEFSTTQSDSGEDMYTSQTPFDFGSCQNRCNETEPDDQYSCDCFDSCMENNTCCPDFAAVCIQGSTDDFMDSTPFTTEMESFTIARASPKVLDTDKSKDLNPPVNKTRTNGTYVSPGVLVPAQKGANSTIDTISRPIVPHNNTVLIKVTDLPEMVPTTKMIPTYPIKSVIPPLHKDPDAPHKIPLIPQNVPLVPQNNKPNVTKEAPLKPNILSTLPSIPQDPQKIPVEANVPQKVPIKPTVPKKVTTEPKEPLKVPAVPKLTPKTILPSKVSQKIYPVPQKTSNVSKVVQKEYNVIQKESTVPKILQKIPLEPNIPQKVSPSSQVPQKLPIIPKKSENQPMDRQTTQKIPLAPKTPKINSEVKPNQTVDLKPSLSKNTVPVVKVPQKPSKTSQNTTSIKVLPNSPPKTSSKLQNDVLKMQTTISFTDITQNTLEIETDFFATPRTLKDDAPTNGMLLESKSQGSNNKMILGVSSGVILVMLVVILATVLIRRYRVFGGFRSYKSQRSDSFSDVRFLASDEVLDFTLKSAD